MKKIVLVSQKGGVGKSILCQELAVCAELKGSQVVILDYDKQRSTIQWFKDRNKHTPIVGEVNDSSIEELIDFFEKKHIYDYLFIDTAGKDDPSSYTAMQYADLCLVPTRARKKDIFPARINIEASARLGIDLVFILNHTPPIIRSDLKERAKALSSYGTLCPVTIGNRVDFQDADDNGMSVLETNPKGKAAQEIQDLWEWIQQFIQKSNLNL